MTKIYDSQGRHVESANQNSVAISILGLPTVNQTTLVHANSDGTLVATNLFGLNESADFNSQLIGATPANSQQSIRLGSLMTPFAYSRIQSFSSVGAIGIDTANSGLTVTNDVVYAFPVLMGFLGVGVTKVKFGVSVADASGTGDVDVALFRPIFANTTAKADCPLGTRVQTPATISNISSTGLQTATIGATPGGGLFWVCLRPDNIGTALTLSEPLAIDAREAVKFFGLTDPEVNTPIYGVYFNSQTSMPSDLTGVTISGYVTTPVGITVSEL